MKNNVFAIKVHLPNKYTVSTVERDKFIKLMEDLRDTFINNEVSTRLVKLIPEIEEIEINTMRNNECDVPFIVCHYTSGDSQTIYIPRSHKIIWSILLGY